MTQIYPCFQLDYYENEYEIDKGNNLIGNLIIIDGFFYPCSDSNKFSLGFQYNHNRSDLTVEYLSRLGKLK